MSWAKLSLSSSSTMAWPPYLMTNVLPVEAADVGQRPRAGPRPSESGIASGVGCAGTSSGLVPGPGGGRRITENREPETGNRKSVLLQTLAGLSFPVSVSGFSSALSQNIAREVLVLDDVLERVAHVGGVDDDLLAGELGAVERDLVEQPLDDRVQPPGADVLGALVDARRRCAAISATASSVNSRSTPSVAISATYCLISAFCGSRQDADEVVLRSAASSSTRIGKRPWNSGIRSDGLETWKAPAAMNRMWSVRTMPYLVLTVEPSTIGSRSRCTPSRETSGPLRLAAAGDLVDLVDEDDARLLDAADRLLGHRRPCRPACAASSWVSSLQRLAHRSCAASWSSWA